MFERYISVDWSGASTEDARVKLRVLEARPSGPANAVDPQPGITNWRRSECRDWLAQALREDRPRSIVAMDFGFGLPWGADCAVFGCSGWHEMLRRVESLYTHYGSARALAEHLNREERFGRHGPFRFNDSRSDLRFYMTAGVGYYRLVELAVPQAISQWYFGSGGTVGFHTITGLAALHDLILRREQKEIDFLVWPHECDDPDSGTHLIVESYPAVFPLPTGARPYKEDENKEDAWKVLEWLMDADRKGELHRYFRIEPPPFGRIDGVDVAQQIRFEGWIIGVK